MRSWLGWAVASTLATGQAGAADLRFELAVGVAEEDGKPVCEEAWIDAQVAQAERLFSAFGVHFKRASRRVLGERFAHLETRADRDDLVTELEPKRVNVLLVASLRDVDDTSKHRQGVHWRPQRAFDRQYVIVAAVAQPTTLAHELGHFFGNTHVGTVNNLMSYARTSEEVFLDPGQGVRIQAFAQKYVRTKELVPLSGP